MSATKRILILIGVVAIAVFMVYLILGPQRQNPGFHNFADTRTIFGISNFWNVTSNIGFLIAGISGLIIVTRSTANYKLKITFATLFLSVLLVGIGSGYYHLKPDNDRLVFDRIPMTLVFMAFLSSAISQCISRKWGLVLLFPLLCVGTGSVLWWHYTESIGAGDLRYYAIVQFLPMLLVPLIFILFPSADNRKMWPLFGWIIGWYILAKILEHFDFEIFQVLKVISGHSLKHVAASVATFYFINVYRRSAN